MRARGLCGRGRLTFPLALSAGVNALRGGPGSRSFSAMPRRPSAKMALSAKYGFMSAPGTRISRRVADGTTDGGETIRTDAARESYPYVTAFGAQNASPPTRRL